MKRLLIAAVALGALTGCGEQQPDDPSVLLGKWATLPSRDCSRDEPVLIISEKEVVAMQGMRTSLLYTDIGFSQSQAGRWVLHYRTPSDQSPQGIEFALTGAGDLVATAHLNADGELKPAGVGEQLRLYKCA